MKTGLDAIARLTYTRLKLQLKRFLVRAKPETWFAI
jgi:hypothetical protein